MPRSVNASGAPRPSAHAAVGAADDRGLCIVLVWHLISLPNSSGIGIRRSEAPARSCG